MFNKHFVLFYHYCKTELICEFDKSIVSDARLNDMASPFCNFAKALSFIVKSQWSATLVPFASMVHISPMVSKDGYGNCIIGTKRFAGNG